MSTKILPPDLAVRLAWGLTAEWSETTEVKNEAVVAKARLKSLEDMAQSSNDPQEKEYVPKAVEYIRACQRTLANIYASRKLNFDEVQKLRAAQMESVEAYSKLTANWQSAWPRVMSLGIGGSAGAISVEQLLKTYNVNPALVSILGAGVLLLINEFLVLPWVRRRLMMERVRGDYDRNLYYGQFVERTRSPLLSLYLDLDRAHLKAYQTLYDPQADPANIVDGALGGVFPNPVPQGACPHEPGADKPQLVVHLRDWRRQREMPQLGQIDCAI